MRSLLSLAFVFLAATLSTITLAVTVSDTPCYAEICGDTYSAPSKRQATSTTPVFRKDLTNAERLARGLAPKAPSRRASSGMAARQAQPSSLPPVTYTAVIQVFSGTTSLGYVAPDPNYWTPLLTSDITSALKVTFSLPSGASSGSQIDLTEINDVRGPLFGLVVGRDNTSPDIASGDFNYLYLDPVSASTGPGATPQSTRSFFSTSGLDNPSETSVWSVNLISTDLTAQWINTDHTSPATVFFVQNNHLYAGGDANAFHTRYPSPVTTVTLSLVIQ